MNQKMRIKTKILMSVFVLMGFSLIGNAIAMQNDKEKYSNDVQTKLVPSASRLTYEDLKNIGENFVSFLKKTGQSDTPLTQDEISQLFAPSCRKIVNGTLMFSASSAYLEQIANARKAIGKWTIEPLWAIVSPENGAYTIQFKWKGAQMEESITMATLFIDDKGKISALYEVYNLSNPKTLSIQDN